MRTRSVALVLAIGSAVVALACCDILMRKPAEDSGNAPRRQSRFLVQLNGCMNIEANADFKGAIGCYGRALRDVDVFPTIRTNGEIAAHNRIATCYWKLGDRSAAITEFSVSMKLGDKKFAAKAIARIRRGDPPPIMRPKSVNAASAVNAEAGGS